jgi:hypothetical protein
MVGVGVVTFLAGLFFGCGRGVLVLDEEPA